MSHKRAVKDAHALEFVGKLKTLRETLGLSQNEMAEQLHYSLSSYRHYEAGFDFPTLQRLMELVEFFDYDLSGSVNHARYYGSPREIIPIDEKYGHKLIYPDAVTQDFLLRLKQERQRLGLTLTEVTHKVEVNFSTIGNYEQGQCSPMLGTLIRLADLYAILEVIKHEQEAEKERERSLKKLRRQDSYIKNANYPHRRRNYA